MPHQQRVSFRQWTFDLRHGVLKNNAKTVSLEPKVFAFLHLLISNKGEVLSKEKVLETLWTDPDKADERLRALVKKTREILDDNARSPVFIKTIPKQGYRFLPDIMWEVDEEPDTKLSKRVNVKLFLIVLTVVTLLLMLIYWSVFSDGTGDENAIVETIAYETEQITEINGDVITHSGINQGILRFNENNGVLKIYSDAAINADYTFDLRGGELINTGLSVTKLAAYFITNKGEKLQFHFWDLSDTNHVLFTRNIPVDFEQILAFDAQTEKLTVVQTDKQQYRVIAVSLSDPNNQTLLFNFDTAEDSSATVVINPSLTHLLVYETNMIETNVRFVNVESGEVSQKWLSSVVQQAVWMEKNTTVLLKTNESELISMQATDLKSTVWQTDIKLTDNLLGTCGESCLLIERAGVEQPVYRQSISNVDNSAVVAMQRYGFVNQVTSLTARNDAVFVSVSKSDSSQLIQIENNAKEDIASLSVSNDIDQLNINANGTILAGRSTDRIFTYDVQTKQLEWLDIPMTRVGFPVFDRERDDVLFFTALEPELGNAVFRFELTQRVYERIAKDFLIYLPLPNGLRLQVTKNGVLTITNAQEKVFESHIATFQDLYISATSVVIHHRQQRLFTLFDFSTLEARQKNSPLGVSNVGFAIDTNNNGITYVGDAGTKHILKLTQVTKSF